MNMVYVKQPFMKFPVCCLTASVRLRIHQQIASDVHRHEHQLRPQQQVLGLPQKGRAGSGSQLQHTGLTGKSLLYFSI